MQRVPPASRGRRSRLAVESLEGRQLLSGGMALARAAALAQSRTASVLGTARAQRQAPVRADSGAQPQASRAGITNVAAAPATASIRQHPLRSRDLARGAVAASVQFLRGASTPAPSTTVATATPPATVAATTPSVATPPQPAIAAPTSPARDPAAVIRQVIDLTNQARDAEGLPPLAANDALTQAAAIQSANMARLGQMSHDLPGVPYGSLADRAEHVGYVYKSLGENIAYNQPDGPAVVAAWLASPPHRANMLSPDFTEIGVGVAWSSRGEPYYTMELGKPA